MKYLIVFVCVLGLISSCKKKKEDKNETTSTYTPPASNPVAPDFFVRIPSDASGVLHATRIPVTFSSNYTTHNGNARGFFYQAPGDYHYIDAGTVTCNDSTLMKISGGSYSFDGKAIDGQTQSGLNYSSGALWNVSGSSSVPAFTVANSTFPGDAILTSATTFTHNASYNVTFSGAAGADSVVIFFGCDSVLLKRTVAASAGSYSYTAAQVASVKKKNSGTTGYFTLMPCKLTSNSVSGKKYYLLNSTTMTYTVTIQ